MSDSTTITVRIPNPVKDRLDNLAGATSRKRSYLVVQAIDAFLDANEWQVRAIKEAVEEADRPDARFYDHQQIKAQWEAKLAGQKD